MKKQSGVARGCHCRNVWRLNCERNRKRLKRIKIAFCDILLQNSLSFRTFNFTAGQKKFGTRPRSTCREQRGSCVMTRRPELTPSISIIHLYIMTTDLSFFLSPSSRRVFFMILLRILILVAPLLTERQRNQRNVIILIAIDGAAFTLKILFSRA